MTTADTTVVEPAPAPTYVASYRMTYEEFLNWDHEGGLAEWVDGEVFVYISTKREHQRVVDFLNRLLGLFVQLYKLGVVTTGPYAMRATPEGPGREPDLFFVATENLARITSQQLEGPADLVVEIVSDDSVSRDRDEKFFEYQNAGVREYWIIDPRPNRRRADFYTLDARKQYRLVLLDDNNVYRSTVLPNFWLNTDWLWTENPNPLAALAEIIGVEQMMAAMRAEA